MKKNQIGKSDIHISALTLGCMSLGQNKSEAQKMIEAAIDSGINHLDTADLYDFGRNEQIIGEIIKPFRNDVIITSKVGNHFNVSSWMRIGIPSFVNCTSVSIPSASISSASWKAGSVFSGAYALAPR